MPPSVNGTVVVTLEAAERFSVTMNTPAFSLTDWAAVANETTGIVVATPLIANVNGVAAVGSFSAKLTVAVRVPPAVGVNWTVNVVEPPTATELLGWLVTVKSPELVPPIETVPTVKGAVPLLVIV